MKSVLNVILNPFKNISTMFSTLGNSLSTAISTAVSGSAASVKGSGETLAGYLFTGMKTGYDSNKSFLTGEAGIVTQIKKAFTMDLSAYGEAAVSSWVAGAKTAKFPVPHINRKANNKGITIDGKRIEVPEFEVKWYKKGGLFTGGSGQIIGVAEGNRDEAVLPLEDRRAMARIASAIVDASNQSGIGIDPVVIAGAVTQGVAAAMSRNTMDNDRPIVAELECDGVTLARAVARGQRELDQRYHPVAQLG